MNTATKTTDALTSIAQVALVALHLRGEQPTGAARDQLVERGLLLDNGGLAMPGLILASRLAG
jgi:hypothetical protein